jgi:hypothetical protein
MLDRTRGVEMPVYYVNFGNQNEGQTRLNININQSTKDWLTEYALRYDKSITEAERDLIAIGAVVAREHANGSDIVFVRPRPRGIGNFFRRKSWMRLVLPPNAQ